MKGTTPKAIRRELARLLELRAFESLRRPHLTIKHRARKPVYTGWAFYQDHAIDIVTWPEMTRCEADETLVHELVHLKLGPKAAHGPEFQAHLREALHEAYGQAHLREVRCAEEEDTLVRPAGRRRRRYARRRAL